MDSTPETHFWVAISVLKHIYREKTPIYLWKPLAGCWLCLLMCPGHSRNPHGKRFPNNSAHVWECKVRKTKSQKTKAYRCRFKLKGEHMYISILPTSFSKRRCFLSPHSLMRSRKHGRMEEYALENSLWKRRPKIKWNYERRSKLVLTHLHVCKSSASLLMLKTRDMMFRSNGTRCAFSLKTQPRKAWSGHCDNTVATGTTN